MISFLSLWILATLMIRRYNVKDDFDGVLVEFDKIIGLDRLKLFM